MIQRTWLAAPIMSSVLAGFVHIIANTSTYEYTPSVRVYMTLGRGYQ